MTIRDVPEDARNELAARAARAGQSLQEYLRALVIEQASRPTVDDIVRRARARAIATGTTVTTEEILAARDADRS
ncbi:FitA-like ribbon-helix-helix domain-containing protein [Quadrisphaera granulorum]